MWKQIWTLSLEWSLRNQLQLSCIFLQFQHSFSWLWTGNSRNLQETGQRSREDPFVWICTKNKRCSVWLHIIPSKFSWDLHWNIFARESSCNFQACNLRTPGFMWNISLSVYSNRCRGRSLRKWYVVLSNRRENQDWAAKPNPLAPRGTSLLNLIYYIGQDGDWKTCICLQA